MTDTGPREEDGDYAREFFDAYERQADEALCRCLPCPGRGNDGHAMSHCAECCFGTGVLAEIDCPNHGLVSP